MNNTAGGIDQFFFKYTNIDRPKRSVILEPGFVPLGVFYLQSGYVKQHTMTNSGTPLSIHIYRPGAFFPLPWVLNGEIPIDTFEAITPVVLKRAPKQELLNFFHDHPHESLEVGRRLMSGVMGLRKRLEGLVENDAYKKLGELLLYFSDIIGKKDGDCVTFPITLPHRELASWVGTSRETVSLNIEHLKEKGLIRSVGRDLVILSLQKLHEEVLAH